MSTAHKNVRHAPDPAKRSNAHAIEIRFKDGTRAPKVEVEYVN